MLQQLSPKLYFLYSLFSLFEFSYSELIHKDAVTKNQNSRNKALVPYKIDRQLNINPILETIYREKLNIHR